MKNSEIKPGCYQGDGGVCKSSDCPVELRGRCLVGGRRKEATPHLREQERPMEGGRPNGG